MKKIELHIISDTLLPGINETKEYQAFDYVELYNCDLIIIQCEISKDEVGNNYKRTDFYGIRYAQKLRQKGFMGKILFVSILSYNFLVKTNPQNAIISTVGHAFLRIPFTAIEVDNAINNINPLSKIELYDIQTNYCNKSGIAQETLHRLHGLVTDKNLDKTIVKNEIDASIRLIGDLYNRDIEDIINSIDLTNIKSTLNQIDSYFNSIISFDDANNEFIGDNIEKRAWSILILDDELDETHSLVRELNQIVSSIYCCKNYHEAEEILKKNISEGLRISLVISDYRLIDKSDGIIRHQSKQGYTFLMETAEKYPFLGLVALSSLPRKFLIQTFKKMSVRASIYSKKDYFKNDNTIQLMINDLIEIGEESFNAISRHLKLSSPQWRNFEPFYIHHRCSIDYKLNESIIANKAKAYCDDFLNKTINFDLVGYRTELKGKTKTPNNPKGFQEFIDKMVCRRVVIWYSQFGKKQPILSPKEILPFLQGRLYNPDYSTDVANNQINTNLALRLSDYPWNTTIEEREWLVDYLRVDEQELKRIEKIESKILLLVQSLFNDKDKPIPNTFINSKVLITERMNKSANLDDFVELQKHAKKITERISILSTQESSSKSIIDFLGYLKRISLRIDKILRAKQIGHLPVELEKTKKTVIKKAKKFFSYSNELKEGIEVSALLFFYHLKEENITYGHIDGFVNAFHEFHKESMGYVNPFLTVNINTQILNKSNE